MTVDLYTPSTRSSDDPSSDSPAQKPEDKEANVELQEAGLSSSDTLADDPANYPQGLKLILLLLSIYLAIFLVALDRTIITTAVPTITNEFHSFGDVGWYNAAFLLPTISLQLFFGRLYTFYSPKYVFLALIFVFEVGSVLCGAAPNSIAFIWGRAIAGLGAGGLFNGALILITHLAPLAKRPLYVSLIGAIIGLAFVAGPLLGGVFTTKASWRWCFYINLPIGAVAMLLLFFVVDNTPPAVPNLPFKEKVKRVDIPGTLVLIPSLVCASLALQWGGTRWEFSNVRIIVLLVLFKVLMTVFVWMQRRQGDNATVPARIFAQRTIAGAAWYSFTMGAAFLLMVYYLPLWFQAVKGASAVRSGSSTLPFVLSLVAASVASGVFTTKAGYPNPPMIAGSACAACAAGLAATLFRPATAPPTWIGVQVLFGCGVGLGLQQPNIAAQAVLAPADLPTGLSVMILAQSLGGSLAVSFAQSLLLKALTRAVRKLGLGLDPALVTAHGATDIKTLFPAALLPKIVHVYNKALTRVFYCVLAYACASVVGALLLRWVSTKKPRKGAA